VDHDPLGRDSQAAVAQLADQALVYLQNCHLTFTS
jgi:hypothetical protein